MMMMVLWGVLAGPAGGVEVDAEALAAWNVERVELTRAGMWVLAGWGAASVGVGAVGYGVADDRRWEQFHLMTIGWGAIDLALAGASLWGADAGAAAGLSVAESLDAQLWLERVLLFNAGLDVGYLGLGAWLWERGVRKGDARLRGFGQAILVQGAFLLVFDATLFWLEAGHGEALRVMLMPGGAGVSGVF